MSAAASTPWLGDAPYEGLGLRPGMDPPTQARNDIVLLADSKVVV